MVNLGFQILHENVTVADTLVGNALAFLDLLGGDAFLEALHVIFSHRRNYPGIEPAVTVGEVLRIVPLHPHLGMQLTQHHLPLILVAQTVDHFRHAHRFAGTVVRAGHHMEHLRHDPATEQASVRDIALVDDLSENRIVIIQHGQQPVLVGSDTLAAVGTLHGEEVAHIHAGRTERLDTFFRCLGYFCLPGGGRIPPGYCRVYGSQTGVLSDNGRHYSLFLVRDGELCPAAGTQDFCLWFHTDCYLMVVVIRFHPFPEYHQVPVCPALPEPVSHRLGIPPETSQYLAQEIQFQLGLRLVPAFTVEHVPVIEVFFLQCLEIPAWLAFAALRGHGVFVTAVQFLHFREELVLCRGRNSQLPVALAIPYDVCTVDFQASPAKVYLEFCTVIDCPDGFLVYGVHIQYWVSNYLHSNRWRITISFR